MKIKFPSEMFDSEIIEWAMWNSSDCVIPVTIIKTMPLEYKLLFFSLGLFVGGLVIWLKFISNRFKESGK